MKYFLYARRSTDEEKQALSIDSQLQELQQRFGHLEIVEVITENGSAFKPYNRPKFAEMLRRIEKGDADGIIAWHPDRLSRNPIDAAQLIYALDRGPLKDLQFASYIFTNSPEGKMMLSFALSQSKYQSEKLGIDAKRGMITKCKMGQPPVKAQVGYINVNIGERGKCYIAKDEIRFPLMQKAWQLLLTGGYTVPQIHRIARDEWGLTLPATKKYPERPITVGCLYKVFSSSLAAGYFEWDGQIYKGEYEPMISFADYEMAQMVLGRDGKHRNNKHNAPFTGLIRCAECGSMITSDVQRRKLKNGGVNLHIYYRCCGSKGPCYQTIKLNLDEMTKQLRGYVEAITISKRLMEWVKDKLAKMHEMERKGQKKQLEDFRRRYDHAMQAIQNLVKLYVSVGNMDKSALSDEEYTLQKKSLMKDRDHAKALLDENERNVDSSIDRTIQTFEFSTNALGCFDKGSHDRQRVILLAIGSNWTMRDGIVQCDARFPFLKIKEGLERMKQEKDSIELRILAVLKPENELSQVDFSLWQPHGGSNSDFLDENQVS